MLTHKFWGEILFKELQIQLGVDQTVWHLLASTTGTPQRAFAGYFNVKMPGS
jgi:hypothetical protein